MSEIGDPLAGSIDEAALAIENLYKGGGNSEPAPDNDTDIEDVAAQLEAAVPQEQNEAEETPVEAKPEGDVPDEPASTDAKPTQPAKEQSPQPEPAKQAAPKAEDKPKSASPKLSDLESLVAQYQAQIQVAFPDIKTLDDLERLSLEPGGQERIISYSVAERKLQTMQAHLQQVKAAELAEWRAEQQADMKVLFPELDTPEKQHALSAKLTAYAKDNGYSQERIDRATAKEAKVVHKAMLYDERVAADKAKARAEADAIIAAKKKAADAPPVQKPGVAKQSDKKTEKAQELSERFRKSGRIDDLAALLDQRA